MSQYVEDPLVLHVRCLIAEGQIACSRDLTEYLDTIGADPELRQSIVGAGIYRMLGEMFSCRLADSMARCRKAIGTGEISSLLAYDAFLHEEATRLSPSDPQSAYRTLKIESRQSSLYDSLEAGESILPSPRFDVIPVYVA